MGTSAEHEHSYVSKKRLLTGNFQTKIFKPKFNTFMNIITTILQVRFLWGFLRNSCITGKTKLETYQIYNLQADKQLNETQIAIITSVHIAQDVIEER